MHKLTTLPRRARRRGSGLFGAVCAKQKSKPLVCQRLVRCAKKDEMVIIDKFIAGNSAKIVRNNQYFPLAAVTQKKPEKSVDLYWIFL